MLNGNNNIAKPTTITQAMEHTQAAITMTTNIETDTIIEMTIVTTIAMRMATATASRQTDRQTDSRKTDIKTTISNCTNGDDGDGKTK